MHNITDYKILTDRDHVLLRAGQYLGNMDSVEKFQFMFHIGKSKEVKYIPAVVKLFEEIIANSFDEHIRTSGKWARTIKIKIDEKHFEVWDSGRGIPSDNIEGTDMPIVEALFCKAKSGSNFSDDNRETVGLNGVGSFISNVWSKRFQVISADGKYETTMICEDNLDKIDISKTKSSKNFTNVICYPDFKRFGIEGFNIDYFSLLRERLYILSYFNPQVSIYLNEEKLESATSENLSSSFIGNFEMVGDKNYFISVGTSEDEFEFVSFVNGILLPKGGSHITYISKEISNQLFDKLTKKYPEFKKQDIKNKLKVIAFINKFPNMRFSSQSKEELTNSEKEFRDYGLNIDLIVSKLWKNKEFCEEIILKHTISNDLRNEIAIRKSQSGKKKLKIEKYFEATKEKKYLVLGEGDSAVGGLMSILQRNEFSYFTLRGKPLNTYEASLSLISKNEEMMNLLSILEIKIGEEVEDIPFEKIIIGSDQDTDGLTINGLLLAFFNRFIPKIVEQGRIVRFNTPIVFVKGKDGPTKWAYTLTEGKEKLKGEKFISYSKGIGSWKASDLKHIIKTEGFNNMLMSFTKDSIHAEVMNNWLSGDKGFSDIRKTMIQKTKVDLELV